MGTWWVVLGACTGAGPASPADAPAPTVPTADTAATAPPTDDTGVEWRYEATFAGIERFDVDYCRGCHHEGSTVVPWGVSELLRTQLVDGDLSMGALVVPGDAEASLLWRSLVGEPGVVGMPLNVPEPMPLEWTGHVRAWIEAGAVVD